MTNDKEFTKKLIDTINNGTIKEIREIILPNFHKIKHTETFGLLLDRLERRDKVCEHFIQDYTIRSSKLLSVKNTVKDVIKCLKNL